MLTRRSFALHENVLRKLLNIPDDVEIIALKSSSDPLEVYVIVAATDFKHWPESEWGDDSIRGSEANILKVDHFYERINNTEG